MFYDDQPFGIYVFKLGNTCNARVLSQCAILVNAAIRSRLCAISMLFDALLCFSTRWMHIVPAAFIS